MRRNEIAAGDDYRADAARRIRAHSAPIYLLLRSLKCAVRARVPLLVLMSSAGTIENYPRGHRGVPISAASWRKNNVKYVQARVKNLALTRRFDSPDLSYKEPDDLVDARPFSSHPFPPSHALSAPLL